MGPPGRRNPTGPEAALHRWWHDDRVKPVVVVGAGIAGVAAAQALVAAGRTVTLLDRGRVIGGRLASRRTEGRPVDIGASYFTVSDPLFEAVVESWRARGLARPWTDTFAVAADGGLTDKSGPMRWAAPAGLRSLVEDLATGLQVQQQTVSRIGPGLDVDGSPAEAVVLAMPDPQARRLLDPAYAAEIAALDDPFDPVLALTARWSSRTWADVDGVFVSDHPVIAWIADDGRRRGDDAPVLVAHSTSEFAAQHLEAPDEAAPSLVEAVRDVLAPRPGTGEQPRPPLDLRQADRPPQCAVPSGRGPDRTVRRRVVGQAPGRVGLPVRSCPRRGPGRPTRLIPVLGHHPIAHRASSVINRRCPALSYECSS